MSEVIRIRKGLDLHLHGEAAMGESLLTIEPQRVAIVPDDFQGFVPRLLKKEGDLIEAGEALAYDKNSTSVVVCSPISGKVEKIVRGERRKILAITIVPDSSKARKTFDVKAIASDPKQALLDAGLWAMFTQRPYGVIPSPDICPRDIFVSCFDSSPLAPSRSLMIENSRHLFEKGVEVLSQLTAGTVYLGCRKEAIIETPHSTTTVYEGPHPAGNAGVQIAQIKPVNKGETVWTIEPETVVKIGGLFTEGYVDYSCIVGITGELVEKPRYVKTIQGAAISDLLKGNIKEGIAPRIIAGNPLTGKLANLDGFLRYPYRQITVIPEVTNDCELLGWASLSTKKYSAGRTFFSWLMPKKKKYHFDAKINGGERAIIMSGEYDKMLPMDIYSEFLIKAIIARDIDKMEQLGIYEVVPEDFALCEFIDTSKLELQRIVREGLDYLRKEMN